MHTQTPATSAPAAAQTRGPVESKDGKDSSKIPAISLSMVGVAALFSYFFHIDYFPLFDLQAATSYLLAVTWVLVGLLILLALNLLMPYLAIGMTFKTRKTEKGERRLTSTIIVWTAFGMLSLIASSAGVLLSIWMAWHILWGLLASLTFSLLLCAWRTRTYTAKYKSKYGLTFADLRKKTKVRNLFLAQLSSAVLSCILQLAPLSMLLLIFSHASGLAEDDYLAFFWASVMSALFIAAVGGVALHVAFMPRYRKRWWVVLCLMLVLPWIVSGLPKATGMLPMNMAQITKIGNFRAQKLVLSPKACGSVAPILGMACDEKTSPPIQLCNVHVMSRVGPETYLRIADRNAGEDGKFPIHRVFIPSTEITSMQVSFEIKNLRLDLIDADLSGRSSSCDTTLTILHADSAFDFNDFTLTDSGKTQLLTFVEEIKNGVAGVEEIKVTGHADQIGRAQRNNWLSARRAQEVKLFMEKHLKNLTPEIKIDAISQGSTQPLTTACGVLTTHKERIKCEAPNRRVELEIIRKAPARPA